MIIYFWDGWMGKVNVVYTHSGILLSLKREVNPSYVTA